MEISDHNLANILWAAYERVKQGDQVFWNAVVDELDKGNRRWLEGSVGHSATEMAVKEIRRLYAIEATLKLRVEKNYVTD